MPFQNCNAKCLNFHWMCQPQTKLWKTQFSSFLAKPIFFVFTNCNVASNQKVFNIFKGFSDIKKLLWLQFCWKNNGERLLFIEAEATRSEAATIYQVSSANVFTSSKCSKSFSRSYNGIILKRPTTKMTRNGASANTEKKSQNKKHIERNQSLKHKNRNLNLKFGYSDTALSSTLKLQEDVPKEHERKKSSVLQSTDSQIGHDEYSSELVRTKRYNAVITLFCCPIN